jgi:hypothetical protein
MLIEFLNVLAAAVVAFAAGALWYMALSKPWLAAVGIPVDADGTPEGGQGPGLFAYTFVMQLLVAGMMRHVFQLAAIDTLGAGAVAGLGVGLFFITPWIAINNAYGMRPPALTLIDGGYATLACTLMGVVLVLF